MLNDKGTNLLLAEKTVALSFRTMLNDKGTNLVSKRYFLHVRFRTMLNATSEVFILKKVNRIEKHNIKKNNEFYGILDELCFKSKNIYNYGNYIVRQEFIKTSKEKEEGIRENANWIRYNDLCKICKTAEPFKDFGSPTSQATLKILDRNWKSFFASIKDYSKCPDKYLGRPKLPKYLDKDGKFICVVNNQQFKIVDGYVRFSFSTLKPLNGTIKTNIPEDAKLMQLRIIPKNDSFQMHIVYEIEVTDSTENTSERIAAIDLGINNLMTVTTNCGVAPVVINGRPLKSMNQYYNKKISNMRSDLKLKHNKDWSNEMGRFTSKHNRKIDDYIHKATKKVIDYCVENNIDTLVCGYNKGWKQESDIGKVNNQKFVQIPYLSLVQRLEYKCEDAVIKFIMTEESYTSGTSFLDNEEPKKENYDKTRRVHRGLFVSNNGTEINADVNGSYQIMKKVFKDVHNDGFECHPTVVNI